MEKANKYTALALHNNHTVLPATLETTGRMSKGFRKVFQICEERHDREAFERTATQRTWASATFRQYYMQRVAIAFWSGSLAMQQRRERLNAHRARTTSSFLPPPPPPAVPLSPLLPY